MWTNAQRDGRPPNIGGALCSTPQSLADAHYYMPCSNTAKTRKPLKGLLDNSRIRQLADCQLADWTTRGCHRRLCVLSFPFWRHLRDRELSSYR